jgi:SAM-dependent methyltransferase
MTEYAPEEWGDTFADVYDEWRTDDQARATVEFLVGRADDGPVLELGSGTGRLTVGMAAHGLQVHGVDASERMLDRLAARPDQSRIHAHHGDITDLSCLPSGVRFSLAYVTASTLFLLPDQEAQLRCLAGAAERLLPKGRLVVEAMAGVPEEYRASTGLGVGDAGPEPVVLNVSRHDPVQQRVVVHRLGVNDGEVRIGTMALRYAWPAEIDLMARLAGLSLAERHGGWRGEPFTADSSTHVSVYEAG